MKKFLMMLMAVVSVFVMTGCADSPDEVVAQWGEAILAGDKAAADEFVTAGSKDANALMILAATADKEDFQKGLTELEEKGEVVINGDKAEIKVDGKTEFILKKVDGDWKIDFEAMFGGDDDDEDEE
jgi:hypothetical protein